MSDIEIQECTVPTKLTDGQADALLAKLSAHYGEPVKPISQYCRAFRVWQKAIEDACLQETNEGTKLSFQTMLRDIQETALHVAKSNLLWRLLYLGEGLRIDPCPIHKGHWSGCVWDEDACPHCMSGSNVTGWVK
jgi:hypothetical protein